MKNRYEVIPVGKGNGITLDHLANLWGVNKRMARCEIAKMIENDMIVCNLRNGYFRPANNKEVLSYLRIIRSYKCKLQKKEYRLYKALQNANQQKMEFSRWTR